MKLSHTPHPWRAGRLGSVVCNSGPDRGLGKGDLEYYGGHLLVESIAAQGDQELIALAPTAPHECDEPGCPGASNRRRLAVLEKLKELIDPDQFGAVGRPEGIVEALRRRLDAAALANQLSALLAPYVCGTGVTEGAVEVLRRMLAEHESLRRDVARLTAEVERQKVLDLAGECSRLRAEVARLKAGGAGR